MSLRYTYTRGSTEKFAETNNYPVLHTHSLRNILSTHLWRVVLLKKSPVIHYLSFPWYGIAVSFPQLATLPYSLHPRSTAWKAIFTSALFVLPYRGWPRERSLSNTPLPLSVIPSPFQIVIECDVHVCSIRLRDDTYVSVGSSSTQTRICNSRHDCSSHGSAAVSRVAHCFVQGGSNLTGTNCDLFTHKSSRSYLNHIVLIYDFLYYV